MKKYDFITIILLAGLIMMIVHMVKSYEHECEKRGGKAQVYKATMRGLEMRCNDGMK